jgi:hypothetical protein
MGQKMEFGFRPIGPKPRREGAKTKAKDDTWNESPQSRKTNRRISKGGFALLSLFFKLTEHIPSTFHIPTSTIRLLFTNQCFSVILQQLGAEEKKTKLVRFAHPPEAEHNGIIPCGLPRDHSMRLTQRMAANGTVILSESWVLRAGGH